MKIYISGPMTGIPDFNRPAFDRAADDMCAAGHEPVLPVQYVEGKTYEEYLSDDIKMLLDCDGIYMLDGWKESKGAKIKHMIALACGIDEVKI